MGLNLKESVKSVMQLATAHVAVKFLGIFMLAFFTRYLTKEELSILPVYAMMAALAPVFFGFGIPPTILRLLPAKLKNNPAEARGMALTSAIILILGALLFTTLTVLFSQRLSETLFGNSDFAYLVRILSLGFFFAAARVTTHFILWASARFDRISIIRMTGAIGRAVFAAGLLLAFGLKGLAWGLVINEIVCFSLSLIFLRKFLFGGKVIWQSPLGIIKQSLPFYFESFLIYFRSQGDNWIVATILGPEAIAIYYVAKRLPEMLHMLLESVDKIVTSEISKRRENPTEIRDYIRGLQEIFAHLMLPFVGFVVGMLPVFIFVVAGPSYSEAIIPGIILCLMQLSSFLTIPLSRGIFVTRPPKVRVVLTIIESIVLISLLFLLSPIFEEKGVAISRLAAAIAGLSASYLLLRRTLQVGIPWRQYLISASGSGLMSGIILVLIYWRYSILLAPVHALAGILFFLFFVSITNSPAFYASINRLTPFRVVDPFRFIFGFGDQGKSNK